MSAVVYAKVFKPRPVRWRHRTPHSSRRPATKACAAHGPRRLSAHPRQPEPAPSSPTGRRVPGGSPSQRVVIDGRRLRDERYGGRIELVSTATGRAEAGDGALRLLRSPRGVAGCGCRGRAEGCQLVEPPGHLRCRLDLPVRVETFRRPFRERHRPAHGPHVDRRRLGPADDHKQRGSAAGGGFPEEPTLG